MKIFGESAQIAERSVIGPAYLADLVAKLDGELDKALDLLSAPRDWYRAEFESHGDSDLVAAWDRIPSRYAHCCNSAQEGCWSSPPAP